MNDKQITMPEVITSTAALQRAAERMSHEPVLAFDLEADSMHHYQEKVCLVQISTSTESVMVDPLACPDLAPIAPLLADPAIRKIFHGADYDVRSLHRDFGIEIHNLFDTMIACQFLGETEVGLAAVLKKRFGVDLDKRFQQADWSRRPLSAEMLDYAVKDTSLLIPLYRQLEIELQAKGRLVWVLEECELLSRVRVAERGEGPLFIRFKGASRMAPPVLAILEELLRFRDAEAQRRDLPPFKVLGAESLREIAERRPMAIPDLGGITGLSPRLLDRYGRQLLEAVARGVSSKGGLPVFPHTSRHKRTPDQEARLKKLKAWREAKADGLGVAPGLLANNALLEGLAEGGLGDDRELSPGLKEWQRNLFGSELETLLHRIS